MKKRTKAEIAEDRAFLEQMQANIDRTRRLAEKARPSSMQSARASSARDERYEGQRGWPFSTKKDWNPSRNSASSACRILGSDNERLRVVYLALMKSVFPLLATAFLLVGCDWGRSPPRQQAPAYRHSGQWCTFARSRRRRFATPRRRTARSRRRTDSGLSSSSSSRPVRGTQRNFPRSAPKARGHCEDEVHPRHRNRAPHLDRRRAAQQGRALLQVTRAPVPVLQVPFRAKTPPALEANGSTTASRRWTAARGRGGSTSKPPSFPVDAPWSSRKPATDGFTCPRHASCFPAGSNGVVSSRLQVGKRDASRTRPQSDRSGTNRRLGECVRARGRRADCVRGRLPRRSSPHRPLSGG